MVMNEDPRIYGVLYLVKVPSIATLNEFDLQHRGVALPVRNGIPQKVDVSQLSNVMLPLIKIADIAYQGYPVHAIGDSVNGIHVTLEEYLADARFNPSPNAVTETDDIVKLEYLAQSVFDINLHRLYDDYRKNNSLLVHQDSFGLMPVQKENKNSVIMIPDGRL